MRPDTAPRARPPTRRASAPRAARRGGRECLAESRCTTRPCPRAGAWPQTHHRQDRLPHTALGNFPFQNLRCCAPKPVTESSHPPVIPPLPERERGLGGEGSAAFQELPVHPRRLLRRPLPRKLPSPRPPLADQLLPPIRVLRQLVQGLHVRRRIAAFDDHRRVAADLFEASSPRRHHREPRGERFEYGETKAFVERRKQ